MKETKPMSELSDKI